MNSYRKGHGGFFTIKLHAGFFLTEILHFHGSQGFILDPLISGWMVKYALEGNKTKNSFMQSSMAFIAR